MAAYITVLNYAYSLCVLYYNVLSCVADVADCRLQRLSAIVIKRHYYYYYYLISLKQRSLDLQVSVNVQNKCA